MIAAVLIVLVVHANPLLERTVVVINTASPASSEIGQDYMRKRGVRNKLEVACPDSAVSADKESIPYRDFQKAIEEPVREYLAKHPKIDFVVLTKGIPIRINAAPNLGADNKTPSVDSFLAALDYGAEKPAVSVALKDAPSGFSGTAWANRFWNAKRGFSHGRFGGYLVTRLDGYTVQDAKDLIIRSLASEARKPTGTFLLDACPQFGFSDSAAEPMPIYLGSADPINRAQSYNELPYDHYNGDMVKAESLLAARNIPVKLDRSGFFAEGAGLMGYVSWGSNDSRFDANAYRRLTFARGALAETAVSTSARTFLPTTGGQSLIADLVAQGVTGVKGYTDEPLLQAVASPSILFDRYTKGWTLAESYYAASRFVGWEDVVIGDPLCRPYHR